MLITPNVNKNEVIGSGGGGGQASWAKFTTLGAEANSTDLLSNPKCKQSRASNYGQT